MTQTTQLHDALAVSEEDILAPDSHLSTRRYRLSMDAAPGSARVSLVETHRCLGGNWSGRAT